MGLVGGLIVTNKQSEINCWKQPESDADHSSMSNVAFYACPHCKKVEPSPNGSFNYNDLDLTINCSRCKKEIKVWNCSCDTRWQTCLMPRYCTVPENIRKKSKAKGPTLSETRPSKKRLFELNMSVEEILAEDLKFAEEKQEAKTLDMTSRIIDLGKKTKTGVIRSNLLGPILRKRFMGDRTINVR